MPNNALVSALALEDEFGQITQLLAPGSRHVTSIEGVFGAKARSVVVPRTGRHGTRARTRFLDDSLITIAFDLLGDTDDEVWAEYRAISGALQSTLETERRLLWTFGTTTALQSRVRFEEITGTVVPGPRRLQFQAHLRATDPRAYSQTQTTVAGNPLSSTTTGGARFPLMFPVRFKPSSTSSVQLTNLGTTPTPLIFELRGYLLDPQITLAGTDRALVFVGDVAAGDTLTVSNIDRPEVLLNGTANRMNMLVSERSRWFDLPRGTWTINLIARDFGTGASVSVRYRHAYK